MRRFWLQILMTAALLWMLAMMPFRALIRWLYFRYVFREDDYILHYVTQFMPGDLRGLNPVFFIRKVQDGIPAKFRAKLTNVGPNLFEIEMFKEQADARRNPELPQVHAGTDINPRREIQGATAVRGM